MYPYCYSIDLYESTHLPDAAIQFFEMRQEERSPVHRLCMNSFLQPDKQETEQTSKQRLKTKEQVGFKKYIYIYYYFFYIDKIINVI